MIDSIKEYLFAKNERTIDVIGIAVITSVLTTLSIILFKAFRILITKSFVAVTLHIKRLYKKYIKQQLNLNDLVAIEERLYKGGKLKWYEKKSYKKYENSESARIKKSVRAYQDADWKINWDKINKETPIPKPNYPKIFEKDQEKREPK